MRTLHIIYINLERNEERRTKFESMIETQQRLLEGKLQLHVHRFDAIDGYNKDTISNYVANNDPRINPGEKGCLLSHIYALRMAKSMNLDYCMICEDDVELHIGELYDTFIDNFNKRPSNLTCWQLAVCTPNKESTHRLINTRTAFFPYQFACFCTSSYIMTKKGMNIILRKMMKDNKVHLLDSVGAINKADHLLYSLNKTYTSSIPYAISYPAQSNIHPHHSRMHRDNYEMFQKYLSILLALQRRE